MLEQWQFPGRQKTIIATDPSMQQRVLQSTDFVQLAASFHERPNVPIGSRIISTEQPVGQTLSYMQKGFSKAQAGANIAEKMAAAETLNRNKLLRVIISFVLKLKFVIWS